MGPCHVSSYSYIAVVKQSLLSVAALSPAFLRASGAAS